MKEATTSSQFPAFPTEIIKGSAKKFVDLYSPIREVPEAFLWASFCAYFGNAISRYVSLQTDNSEPRLFTVLLGKSARSRKSTSNDAAKEFFNQISGNDQRQNSIEGFGSGEGLVNRLVGNADKTSILYLDEINVLARKTNSDNSVGIAPLHRLFEGHSYENPLAAGGPMVKNAYLSLLSASTVEDFQQTWTAKHKDAGFFSRLFLVAADASEKRIAFPKNPDTQVRNALLKEVQQLIERLASEKSQYPLESEAEKRWAGYYENFGDGEEWNRIDTYGFRLMVIQAALTGASSISVQIVEDVIKLLDFEVTVRRAVLPVIADTQIAQLEEAIRRYLPKQGEGISKRELQRKTNANRKGIEMFNRALKDLENNGELDRSKGKKGSEFFIARHPEDELPDEQSGVAVPSVINPSDDSLTCVVA